VIQLNIKKKIKDFERVINITKKPSLEEYKSASKITLIGIFIIGLIGLIILMIINILKIIF
jgi:protein transport protein SEC61 subunit gamma and related proteins